MKSKLHAWLARAAVLLLIRGSAGLNYEASFRTVERRDAELLWHSYVPNYMEKFLADFDRSYNYVSTKLGVNKDCVRDVSAWIRQLANFKRNPLETQTWALHSKLILFATPK